MLPSPNKADAETKDEAPTVKADAELDADALNTQAAQASLIESQARTIAELQAALAASREKLVLIQSAKTLKAVKEALAA